MVKIVNLTPHEITICGLKVLPSGIIARVEEKQRLVRTIECEGVIIPIIIKDLGEVTNIPEEVSNDIIYVVSLLVAQHIQRRDILTIGDVVRDEGGNIIGAKSLAIV